MNLHYAVMATLGPSTKAPSLWRPMLDAGATAFRLNTSHLTPVELAKWMECLEPFFLSLSAHHHHHHAHESSSSPRLVLDLQGSKWRLGMFQPFLLEPGATITLTHQNVEQESSTNQSNIKNNHRHLPVPHADFFEAADNSSDTLLLNDAKSELRITARSRLLSDGTTFLQAEVKRGGVISPGKGITYSESSFRKEQLSKKDRGIIETYRTLPFVQFAISYVKDAEEMQRYVESIDQREDVPWIAKLERPSALADVENISTMVKELWLCRGDLGAEAGMTEMARLVHDFAVSRNQNVLCSTPTLLAGQVLEHMTHHSTATRSEICTMYDALQNGFSGFVLSDETAIGEHPLESCQTAAIFKKQEY